MQKTHKRKMDGKPWRVAGFRYGPGVIGLHQEIEQFYAWALPTPVEHAIRIEVVQRIEAVILSLWPKAVVEIFGSLRTGLYLPNSDIDLVVFGVWEKLPLRTLVKAIVSRGVAEQQSSRIIENATVPILKIIDSSSKIKVDVSFNQQNGVKTAEHIKKFKREYPPFSKLVLVIKQFILQRDLNEVFLGGISSYALILMIISFLQLHPRLCDTSQVNLGVLLVEFFEFYGRRFNYGNLGICVTNGGRYCPKDELLRGRAHNFQTSLLCIEDPVSPGNIVGRKSYNFPTVKQAFEYGYIKLANAINPNSLAANETMERSILGLIVQIDGDVIQYREFLRTKFAHLIVNSTSKAPILKEFANTETASDEESNDCILLTRVSQPRLPQSEKRNQHIQRRNNNRNRKSHPYYQYAGAGAGPSVHQKWRFRRNQKI